MRTTLGVTGLLSCFEGRMFSATEVGRGKPDPALFLHAAESMGVEPAGCAVVEDTVVGVQAGRAAGMSVFGFSSSGGGRALFDAGAEVFDDMEDLPRLLGRREPD
jgi:beta-phosphoglucomutase-like phosphatase (HAD superfamily)